MLKQILDFFHSYEKKNINIFLKNFYPFETREKNFFFPHFLKRILNYEALTLCYQIKIFIKKQ